MPTINQDEINNVAWRACDTFRGTLDPSDYKNYILVMLFLKYISDVIKDHRAAYLLEFKGDEARVRAASPVSASFSRLVADFDSLYASATTPTSGSDQHRSRTDRGSQQSQARGRVPRSGLQLRGQTRPDQGAQHPHQGPAEVFADPRLDLRPSVSATRT
jgi:type I restriction enzyme M protein